MSSNQGCLSSGVQLSMCINLFELLSNKCVRLGTIYVADCHVNIFIALANTKVTDGGHFCCLTAVNFIKRCQVAHPHTLFATIIQSSLHPERNLRGGQMGGFKTSHSSLLSSVLKGKGSRRQWIGIPTNTKEVTIQVPRQ